jgi:hypothetical protein
VELVPPFTFVGMEPVAIGIDHDDPCTTLMERFLDAKLTPCSMADLYRHEFRDGSVGDGTLADAQRQIEAAGYVQVADPLSGTWHWGRQG